MLGALSSGTQAAPQRANHSGMPAKSIGVVLSMTCTSRRNTPVANMASIPNPFLAALCVDGLRLQHGLLSDR
ncbi:hypothetical protein [Kibdelosporangium philippinense]|uniref:hypothetical protein n=1 Tax=Kibdelosporangium philippinense TaxID=211113 RepID=UPI003621EE36